MKNKNIQHHQNRSNLKIAEAKAKVYDSNKNVDLFRSKNTKGSKQENQNRPMSRMHERGDP